MIKYFCAMHGYMDYASGTKAGYHYVKSEYGKKALKHWRQGYEDAKKHRKETNGSSESK